MSNLVQKKVGFKNNKKLLTIIHQNVDRVRNKIDMLNHLLQIVDPDIVVLTEHGLTQDCIKNTRLSGYSIITEYSRRNHKKGGVAIYCREFIRDLVEAVQIQHLCVELVCEVAMVRIKINDQVTYIIGIYRPPQGAILEAMEIVSSVMDEVPTWKCSVILMGDINVDCLKSGPDQALLNETLLSYNMHRLSLPPTRITPQSMTSIDCVCTNVDDGEVLVKILNAGISDHTAQLCTLNTYTHTNSATRGATRNFKEDNITLFKNILAAESWINILNTSDINIAYEYFAKTITSALNQACPFKKSSQRKFKKKKIWNMESELLRKEFLKSNERYLLTGSREDKEDAAVKKKNYDLKLKQLRQKATATRINCSENKTKAIWAVINDERGIKSSTGPLELNINNKIQKNPSKIAEHLNTVFTTMADTAIKANNPPSNAEPILPQQHNSPIFCLQSTTEEEVINTINSMPNKVSCGIDEISSKLLKASKYEMAYPLTILINMSFKCGKFPNQLKLTKVIPVFKHGDQCQATNYRPISLISTFSKLFEKIVLNRLLNYLTHHNLTTDFQHGFRKNKSTTTALINFIEHIIEDIEGKNTTTAIFLDLSKAFDTLDHEQLVAKLYSLGICGVAAEWFKSYLTNRRQVVEIKQVEKNTIVHIRSHPLPVLRGVPQGSVLGPVLFTLFTNDLPNYLEKFATTIMYADDTVLLLAEKCPKDLEVQSYTAMSMAVQYCHSNSLVVNEAKTQQIIMGRNKEQAVHLPNVETAKEAKYLGVIIDEDLKWTPHIDSLCKKLSTSIYVIKRIKSITDLATTKTAYLSLFEAHLRYGLLVWGNSSASNLQRILVMQKKAVRALAGIQPRESCRPAFINHSILTVVSLYILEAVTFVHDSRLMRGCRIHQYNTRNATDFRLPAHHLALFEKKPSYMGVKLWNHLPEDLKKLNKKEFKIKLKKWLLENPFYKIEEYFEQIRHLTNYIHTNCV